MEMKRRWSFWAGFLSGVGSVTYLYATPSYGNDRSAMHEMRSDWERVGDDFRTVIGRAYGEVPAKGPAADRSRAAG